MYVLKIQKGTLSSSSCLLRVINPLPNDGILDQSNLKAFVDDKIKDGPNGKICCG